MQGYTNQQRNSHLIGGTGRFTCKQHKFNIWQTKTQFSTSRRKCQCFASEAQEGESSQSVSAKSVETVQDVVVVGGGICGLTAALAIKTQHGEKVGNFLVTEARDRVGGNITTVSDDRFLWEEGPNSFTPNDAILTAAVDAGVADELVLGDPQAPRFVFWEGKLRPVPSSPLSGITFDLMSFPGKIRAGLGAIGLMKDPAPGNEESVEQFIKRNLGQEVFYRLIEPFCSGVYAGDPSKLSMKAAFGRIQVLEEKGGSLVGGAIKLMQERKANPPPERDPRLPPKPQGQTVGSFRRGLKTLPEAIEKKLDGHIRLQWTLESVSRDADSGIYSLTYSTPDGNVTVRTRAVAMTAPSYRVADLLQTSCPAAAAALREFFYPPVAAVTLAYPKSAVLDDRKAGDDIPGFGQLHPRTQGVVTLGTIYSSSLFPGRAPEEMILLLNYIGGSTNQGIVDQSEDDLVAQVDKDLRTMLLKADAPKPVNVGVRVWAKAIPQFNLGHLETLAKAQTALAEQGWDGFLLGGNYVSGVALGKVVEFGYTFANDAAAYAKSKAVVTV